MQYDGMTFSVERARTDERTNLVERSQRIVSAPSQQSEPMHRERTKGSERAIETGEYQASGASHYIGAYQHM